MIFPEEKSVSFGSELTLAKDIFVAKEHLQDGGSQIIALVQQYSTQIETLQLQINQRDELLRDLSDKLRRKNTENVSLRNNLLEAQDIIATVELSRDEMIVDLTQVSVDTQLLEANLQHAITEKTLLESELASRLTEIVELNMLNNELESQILRENSDRDDNTTLFDRSDTQELTTSVLGSIQKDKETQAGMSQSLSLSSGREVYIRHQFSGHLRHNLADKVITALRQSCCITLVIVSLLVMIIAASIFVTAAINRSTAGEALDVLITRLTT